MTRQRRKFDTSLKLEVVRIIKEQGLSVQRVSESMSIGPTAIRRWSTRFPTLRGVAEGRCTSRSESMPIAATTTTNIESPCMLRVSRRRLPDAANPMVGG